MNYKIENVNSCTKKFIFQFNSVDLSKEVQTVLKKKQEESNLKGFRKGKAPWPMIEKVYGERAKEEALSQFVSSQFFTALQKEKIQAIGYPVFNNTKFAEGKEVSFEAVVETFPEFEIKDYGKYSFTREKTQDVEKELEKLTNNYLASKAEMIEIGTEDATLKLEQIAIINFAGELENGDKPENMKAKDFMIEIGSGNLIPGFEDAILGMKKNEQKKINLVFPADYHVETLKGKPVVFTVDLLEIKEKKNPLLTDELAKEFGFESASQFKEKNRQMITEQEKKRISQKLHQDILEKLVEANPFDIPSTLFLRQKESLKADVSKNLKSQRFNDKMIESYFTKWDEELSKKAEFQIKSGLILDKLAQKYQVQATEEDFEAKVNEICQYSGTDREQFKTYYATNPELKQNLMYAIREEKTFDMLCKELKIN